jgi:ribonuclease HI
MKIWVDGAGALLLGQKAKTCVLFEGSEAKVTEYDQGTNNEMEYGALIEALSDSRSQGATIYSDSGLVVGQVVQGWKVKADNLRPLVGQARALLAERQARLEWVSREQNLAGKVLERR